MVDHASTSIPKPKNWEDFERCCCVLFQCVLGDPQTQRNGRQGQKQHGVDVFGRRGGQGPDWVGVQCKVKQEGSGAEVSDDELRGEVEKARKFRPKLSEFIICTTAPTDAKIQKVAREITQANEANGQPLSVAVWGWDHLESHIFEHPRALDAFHPDATPYTGQILAGVARIEAGGEERGLVLDGLTRKLDQIHRAVIADETGASSSASETVDKNLHAELDGYRDLIRSARPGAALGLLEALRERIWETATQRIRFRIVTNIGSCKLSLGDEDSAAQHFLEAAQYQPQDKIGMANVALAHLLLGDRPMAISSARSALEQDPTNAEAASYLIQAHVDDQSIDDPATLVPQELGETASVQAAIIVFCRQRDRVEWRDIARQAADQFPDSDEINRLEAEAILDIALTTSALLAGECPIRELDQGALERAISVLQELWDKMKGSDAANVDSTLPYNLAQAYRLAGDSQAAMRMADEALERLPDAEHLIKLRAGLYLETGDTEAATGLLSKLLNDPEAVVMAAEAQLGTEASREVLDMIDWSAVDQRYQLLAGLTRSESFAREGKLEEALQEARDLARQYPESPAALCLLGISQDRCGDSSADQTLSQAKDHLDNASTFFDRLIVAEALERRARHNDVVEILDARVDLSRDSPALQILLLALINSDRRQRAHQVIRALPPNLAETPFFLRAAAALHFNRGDLAAAEESCTKYLDHRPTDLAMRLRWLELLLRLGRESDVGSFLETDVERLEGTATDQMNLASILRHFGFSERALRLGYETLVQHGGEPRVNLRYVGLLIRPGGLDDINLEVERIGPNIVFEVENQRGEKDTFLIEPEKDLRKDSRALAPEHPVAQKAFGLQVGECFILDEDKEPPEQLRIISVKHKWLDALHTIMERFERRFPAVGGLERVVIDKREAEPLEPILSRVKARHDWIQENLDRYESNLMPVQFLAHNTDTDVIRAWHGLSETKRNFHVCAGSRVERQAARDSIELNGRAGCVVDALTLHIIRRLGCEGAVEAICGPIGTTQSAVDVFRQRQQEIALHGGQPFSSMFWLDGQYYKDETTADQLKAALDLVEGDLDWIENHGEILPAEGATELSGDLREVSRRLGGGFLDSTLAADGSGRLLLSEDYRYRILSARHAALRTAWLQPVLLAARDQSVLTSEEYSAAIISLIKAGHYFVAIDALVLRAASNDPREQAAQRFAQVAQALGGPDADMQSHLVVAGAFLAHIWENPDPPLHHLAQTSAIIDTLLRGRPSHWQKVVVALRKLIPHRYTAFDRHLHGWLQGHFLLPFDDPIPGRLLSNTGASRA